MYTSSRSDFITALLFAFIYKGRGGNIEISVGLTDNADNVSRDIIAFLFITATLHTNNIIESYHNQLKSFYLTKSRNKRVDRVVFTLVNLVVCDYRSEHLQVEHEPKDMPLNTAQVKRKRETNLLDLNTAQIMVNLSLVDDETFFTCMYFTKDRAENVFYTVSLSPSGKFIEKCSCPDSSILCKHMFLVSRTHSIPYHDTTAITCRVVDEFSDDISNQVIEEGSDDLRAVLPQQQQLQLDTLSESLEQAYAVLGAQIKDLNKSNGRDPVLLESAIQDIKNVTSNIENTRHPYQHPPRQR